MRRKRWRVSLGYHCFRCYRYSDEGPRSTVSLSIAPEALEEIPRNRPNTSSSRSRSVPPLGTAESGLSRLPRPETDLVPTQNRSQRPLTARFHTSGVSFGRGVRTVVLSTSVCHRQHLTTRSSSQTRPAERSGSRASDLDARQRTRGVPNSPSLTRVRRTASEDPPGRPWIKKCIFVLRIRTHAVYRARIGY